MPTGTKYRLEESICPTCERDDFKSEKAVRMHHSSKHNEKIPNLICENCGDKFHYKSRRAKCDDCIQKEKEERRKREASKPIECDWDDCNERFHKERHMKIHYKSKHGETIAKYPNQNKSFGSISDEYRDPCSNCGGEFINMGQHWKSINCEYPGLSDYQKDLLRGILMSDASVQFSENNRLIIKMTTKDFLEWLTEQLKQICHSKYPILYQTSAEAKENARKAFGDAVREDSEYKEKYQILTRSHPFINTFDEWYKTGEKRYPLDDLDLTPSVAKMWYCGDGGLDRTKGRSYIACTNEKDRIDDVADLIREQGFDVNTTKNGSIRIPPCNTPEFLDWMGEAPPDFEYKWL